MPFGRPDQRVIRPISVNRSALPKRLELETAPMKPLETAIIVVLVIDVAVIGWFYYEKTRNDVKIYVPNFELKP